MLREPWGSTAVPDETHRSSENVSYSRRVPAILRGMPWALFDGVLDSDVLPPLVPHPILTAIWPACASIHQAGWCHCWPHRLPTRVFCVSVSAVGGGSLLSPEGEKVNGGNLYPLSNAGQMQILCWLSCCAMCWQGGLTVSPSLLFGRVVRSSVAARFFSFKQGSRSAVFFDSFTLFMNLLCLMVIENPFSTSWSYCAVCMTAGKQDILPKHSIP